MKLKKQNSKIASALLLTFSMSMSTAVWAECGFGDCFEVFGDYFCVVEDANGVPITCTEDNPCTIVCP